MSSDPYKARRHYQDDAVAGQYDDIRFETWYGRMAHEAEARALDRAFERYDRDAKTVLDIPCGTGRLFDVMLARGIAVTGADISDAMMDRAKARYGTDERVRFQKADAEKLPFSDGTFDAVTSYRLMCHLPPDVRTRVLGEMIRVARRTVIVNYHFDCASPLYLFNKAFRPVNLPSYPLAETGLVRELTERSDTELLGIHKLSWWERSSALVVLRKNGAG